MNEGRKEGMKEGRKEGKKEGRKEGRKERRKEGEFIYGAYKLSHKTLHVHSTRHTRCIQVSSRKLKLPKEVHTNKVQTAPTHIPPPKSATIHRS